MNEILTLANILNRRERGKVPPFPTESTSETLSNKLEKNILSGVYKNDEEAAQDLYGTSAKSNSYQVLKSKLKSRLLSELIFYDRTMEPAQYSSIVFSSEKELLVIKKLLMFGARAFAIKLVQRLLLKAEQYSETEIQLRCHRILREHYWYQGELGKYESSNQRIQILLSQLNDEIRSFEIHERFSLPFVRSKANNAVLLKKSSEAMKELALIKRRTPSREVTMNYFRFTLLHSQIKQDTGETIRICERIEHYFSKNPQFAENARVAEFLLSKAEALFKAKKIVDAEKTIAECISLFPSGGNNWFASQSLALQIAFHSEKWIEAVEMFENVTTHNRFLLQPEQLQEEWRIYEAFLLYILPKKRLSIRNDYSGRIFQLYRFLNEVPIYSRDKLGANIAILILQTLWTVETESYDRIVKLQKTLDNYCARYLKAATEFKRGATLLKMLRSVISNDFNVERIRNRTVKLCSNLNEYGHELGEMEFYPYEKIWDIVLAKL